LKVVGNISRVLIVFFLVIHNTGLSNVFKWRRTGKSEM